MSSFVVTLMPDYGGAFLWIKEGGADEEAVGANGGDCFAGVEPMGWQHSDTLPIPSDLWRALCDWEMRFERAPITTVGRSVLLDWDDYHRQGLLLAGRLKRLWGDAARVRYMKPAEDPADHIAMCREVFADGSCLELPIPLQRKMPRDVIPWRVLQRVHQRLSAISEANDVSILHAIESGSRAWGFASPDSDFDVRFIYAHRMNRYSTVFEHRDVIESPIEDVDGAVFDVNGWDLRKALRLLYKSNPVLIEWLQSPIVYAASDCGAPRESFRDEMFELAKQFHAPSTAHHHYFHMARKNYREHLREEPIRLKKYFYVLRPVLACLWIERGLGLPPMELTELMQGVLQDGPLKDEIATLREDKMRTPEFGSGPRRPQIHAFIKREIERLSGFAPPKPARPDPSALDDFLRRWAVESP